jgi:hypothetical protein
VLTFEGKCSCLRAKSAHLVGHLPVVDDIHVEEQKEVKLSDLAHIGGGEVNA